MYQALQLLLAPGTPDKTTRLVTTTIKTSTEATSTTTSTTSQPTITMLYGNKTVEDILMKEELDEMAKWNPRFKCVYVVGDGPDDPPPPCIAGAEGGWIDKAKIEKYVPAPSADSSVFVCGLPQMYAALCGPSATPEVKAGTVLAELGYSTEHVEKF